ncbi:mediator of RNA polymerase II transcription subunit 6-like [Bolinopsis microptera]|uniref:mediator of RNA polymerase II transcription subunit 6-like n=1 Tax=Bolinopsis microptera TaxID=2820187 RepID=UPI0030795926
MANENPMTKSWKDSNWNQQLNPHNVLAYFCQRSNLFYDKTCNNEIAKMQRLNPNQLLHMKGIEYTLLHVDEASDLMIIRKQERHSPSHVVPLANYYVLQGTIYQAPDLHHVLNSRLAGTLFHLQEALDKTLTMSRYDPNKGHYWSFDPPEPSKEEKLRSEPCSQFQKESIDKLMDILTKKYQHFMLRTGPVVTEQSNIKQETKDEPQR